MNSFLRTFIIDDVSWEEVTKMWEEKKYIVKHCLALTRSDTGGGGIHLCC